MGLPTWASSMFSFMFLPFKLCLIILFLAITLENHFFFSELKLCKGISYAAGSINMNFWRTSYQLGNMGKILWQAKDIHFMVFKQNLLRRHRVFLIWSISILLFLIILCSWYFTAYVVTLVFSWEPWYLTTIQPLAV